MNSKAKGESESSESEAAVMARKYLIETFGCQMNVHDSERMAGLLEQAGFEPTEDAVDADVVVINTCSVRERAEEKLYTRLGELAQIKTAHGHGPIVAVAGCVAQQEGEAILRRSGGVADVVAGTQAIRRLPMLVEQAAGSGRPVVRCGPLRGCDVSPGRHAAQRPREGLRDDHRGLQRVLQFLRGPVHARARAHAPEKRTFWRRSARPWRAGAARCSSWVRSSITTGPRTIAGCDFTGLLEAVHEVPGLERIRFASPHPRHFSDRFLDAMAGLPKLCRHLHLPVQSGSTRVLEGMRRRYTRESYLDLIGRIRASLPDVSLSTDMIVGFPGETDADFEATLSLTAAVRFHSMFSFKYSPRPNTLAHLRLTDDVDEGEKTRRIVALQALQRSIQMELNEALVGGEVEVLVDGASRRRETELSGRTSQNVVVNLPGPAEWIGRLVAVHVERAGPYSVWGSGRMAVSSPPAGPRL